MSDIEISENSVLSQNYKIKSYTLMAVLMLLVLGVLFMVGQFGPDFFALLIFLIIMFVPVILLLKDRLIPILPSFISDNLLEIDHVNEEKNNINFNTSKYTKELGLYIMIVVFLIGSVVFLKKGYNNIDDHKSIYKILGSLACIIISGVILLEVDYV
jgi:hypothetical protein